MQQQVINLYIRALWLIKKQISVAKLLFIQTFVEV